MILNCLTDSLVHNITGETVHERLVNHISLLKSRIRYSVGHPVYKCVCVQCQLCWDDQEMNMLHKVLHMKYYTLYISIRDCVVFLLFTTRLLEPVFVDPLVLGVFQS